MPTPSPLIEAAAASPAPWWGVPVIAGSFLILGGVFGFASNWLLENRKQARAEAIRWDGDIREYVAEIIDLCRRITLVVLIELAFEAGVEFSFRANLDRLTTAKQKELIGDESRESYIKREAKQAAYDNPEQATRREDRFELYQQVDKLVASLDLVAPDSVREAAKKVRQITSDLRTEDAGSPPRRKSTAPFDEAVEALIVAARKHLGRAT